MVGTADCLQTLAFVVAPDSCDENGHMNARFFAERLQDASLRLARRTGATMRQPCLRTLAIRFHSEALLGERLSVWSGLASTPNGATLACHRLVEDGSGRLLATEIEDAGWHPDGTGRPITPLTAAEAGSVDLVFDGPASGAPSPASDTVRTSMVVPREARAGAHHRDGAHVAMFGNGAAAVWRAAGFGDAMMAARCWGRIVTELRYRLYPGALSVESMVQQSSIIASRSRSITMLHRQVDGHTRQPVADAIATGMLIDLRTRRPLRITRQSAL